MSDRTKVILGTAVSLIVALGAVAHEWSDLGPAFVKWSLRVVAVLTVASNVLGLRVVSLRKVDAGKVAGAGAVLLGVLLIGVSVGGCNPQAVAIRTTYGVMQAGRSTGKVVAAQGWTEHRACLVKGKEEYKACAAQLQKRIKAWRTYIRPAHRTSVGASVAAIQIDQQAKSDKADTIALLKPAACAVLRFVAEWGHVMPDKGESLLGYLGPLRAVACVPSSKSLAGGAAPLIAAILPVVVDLIKWIATLVGSPTDKLMIELVAWLDAPAADETDALAAEIAASMGAP